jgi:hypothetical protein
MYVKIQLEENINHRKGCLKTFGVFNNASEKSLSLIRSRTFLFLRLFFATRSCREHKLFTFLESDCDSSVCPAVR